MLLKTFLVLLETDVSALYPVSLTANCHLCKVCYIVMLIVSGNKMSYVGFLNFLLPSPRLGLQTSTVKVPPGVSMGPFINFFLSSRRSL